MKVKFQRTNEPPRGFTTVGYWWWNEPLNRGTLTIIVRRMPWRFEMAVWGHEIIEAFWCWFWGITTEKCDSFDEFYEREYAEGRIPKTDEPGCDARCPYHWGHMLGIVWERLWITVSGGGWKRYESACNRVMGIETPSVAMEE